MRRREPPLQRRESSRLRSQAGGARPTCFYPGLASIPNENRLLTPTKMPGHAPFAVDSPRNGLVAWMVKLQQAKLSRKETEENPSSILILLIHFNRERAFGKIGEFLLRIRHQRQRIGFAGAALRHSCHHRGFRPPHRRASGEPFPRARSPFKDAPALLPLEVEEDSRPIKPITSFAWRAIIDTSGSSGTRFWTPRIRFSIANSAHFRRLERGSPLQSMHRAA